MKIPLSNPDITDSEREAVLAVLRTPNLSLGPKLPEFENKFAAYLGVKHAVAVNSGTSGLHLCVRALGLKDDDEVITTPFSFIASANCLLFERVRPVFVDIDPDTLNIDVKKIVGKINKKTKAILPVHVFGYPCDMKKIMAIANKHSLSVIEDACEAVGAEIDGRKAGTFGDCSVIAFYPNKQMTTGEGGLIATNSAKIALLARSMRNQGRDDGMGWLAHSRLGYNYRLSDINCALGIAQLKRIAELLKRRQRAADLYEAKLRGIQGLILPPRETAGIKRSWFVYVVRLADEFSSAQRDRIILELRAKGIGCSAYFPPIHLQPFYKKEFGFKRGDFPITEAVADRTIALPFFNRLSESQIDQVVKALKAALQGVKK
ncbi:MAG: DegT/DnrJ/EryC1/StrS family aminotransferase [Candidatus Margulisiibacteriota bacterium]